jgi:hypothetical protein
MTAVFLEAIQKAGARRVAFVGIAKHAGKTTAMNSLIEQAAEAGIRLGIVSIGVDGERNDAIMGVPKPEVYVPAGALVASAGDVLTAGSAGLSILEATGISSALGDVYLAKVQEPGTVLLAGIRYAAQVEQVLARMEALGADLCLVDGAFDRMMAASPALTDGVVLATGAVVGNTVEDVVRKTDYFLQRFALPVASPAEAALLDLAQEKGVLVAGVEGAEQEAYQAVPLVQTSPFVSNPQLDPNWPGTERTRALAVTGAVTDRLVTMLEGLPRGFVLVIPDSTHFFVTAPVFRKFWRRGHRIAVRRPIKVFGLTVNPHSIAGCDLPGRELWQAILEIADGIQVADVKRQEA